MTVLDASVVIDLLLGAQAAHRVQALIDQEGTAAAPDLLVFEVLSVLRRLALQEELSDERAEAALADLGDVAVALVPSLILRERAWTMRHRLSAADALFAALALELDEPLATKDAGLANAAGDFAVRVLELP